jgi:malate synthase
MEDLATLEISRAQTWQWLHNAVMLDDGIEVTKELVRKVFEEELTKIEGEIRELMVGFDSAAIEAELGRYRQAKEDACAIFTEEAFRPFLKMRSDLVE